MQIVFDVKTTKCNKRPLTEPHMDFDDYFPYFFARIKTHPPRISITYSFMNRDADKICYIFPTFQYIEKKIDFVNMILSFVKQTFSYSIRRFRSIINITFSLRMSASLMFAIEIKNRICERRHEYTISILLKNLSQFSEKLEKNFKFIKFVQL